MKISSPSELLWPFHKTQRYRIFIFRRLRNKKKQKKENHRSRFTMRTESKVEFDFLFFFFEVSKKWYEWIVIHVMMAVCWQGNRLSAHIFSGTYLLAAKTNIYGCDLRFQITWCQTGTQNIDYKSQMTIHALQVNLS